MFPYFIVLLKLKCKLFHFKYNGVDGACNATGAGNETVINECLLNETEADDEMMTHNFCKIILSTVDAVDDRQHKTNKINLIIIIQFCLF